VRFMTCVIIGIDSLDWKVFCDCITANVTAKVEYVYRYI